MAVLETNLKKRCFLGTELLENSSRKPYPLYRMVPLSLLTLSDLCPGFQGHCILTSRISHRRCETFEFYNTQ